MNYLYLYLAAAAVILFLYMRRYRRLHESASQELKQSIEAGLVEPASLHPVINPARCMGSGSCARACPEEALGVVKGKAVLINASAWALGILNSHRQFFVPYFAPVLWNVAIIAALPFVIVMVGMCLSLYLDLRKDPLIVARSHYLGKFDDHVRTSAAKFSETGELGVVTVDPKTGLITPVDGAVPAKGDGSPAAEPEGETTSI